MLHYLEVEDGFIILSKDEQIVTNDNWSLLPNSVGLRVRDTGVLEIRPATESTRDLVISCGIHGNETAPIEIVSRLIYQIVKGDIQPKVNILFILGNPESMKCGDRFVSINMNRLFCGGYNHYELNTKNQYELERAEKLEQLTSEFFNARPTSQKTHLDLHTAIKPSFHKTFAIRPYSNSAISEASKKLLLGMGIEAVLQHNKPSTTFSYFSVERHNAEAYTLELGKVRPFGENNSDDFKLAISCLESLIADEEISEYRSEHLIEYKVVGEIIRHSDEFKFYVADDVENFTQFPQGSLIAEDIDYNYRVAYQSEAVVFPNPGVPIGQRAAVMVTRVE